MKLKIVLFSWILFVSCNKKEIKLPQIDLPGIQEVQNHSEVWMFYKGNHSESPLELNRNNTISTTHWLYNIDKRLPLKYVIPELQALTYKHANSMHSKEGMFEQQAFLYLF